ncbi:carbohydrate ABC transporter permease [Ohessyouella blattaphilus]|uniref:Sugar ABC transporter permease n=1 Tax=Ohessyouella blattaphilus TaxID=2949333 RepID=A0ABT1EIG5_9FIRM|nr:sugar ABC transporter permease [Ohessyouella blattaphilus]MCP1109557.1 sugar ABC transporter permease [Ohessyouella blattaphilus]MCR8562951.1 sugar ABC transporter permease [Ohessyouella blattaphilus]
MKRQKKWIAIFLAPALALFGFVFLISIIRLGITSFTDWTIGTSPTFAGLDNYIYLITEDKEFRQSIVNTLIWIVLQATIHVSIGTILALIIRRQKWYTNFMRSVFMIPNIISSAALGMLFLCIMNPEFGMVNQIIRAVTKSDFSKNWFMGVDTAFFTVTMTWLPYAGLVTILVMAEMASISEGVLEAARVDGATDFQIDTRIVLPMMRNIIGTSTVLAATSMLQKLDIIMMTTNGGPAGKTMNMPLYLYRTALTNNNYGLANTQGVILILMGLIIVALVRGIYRMDKE